ncbi:hypothetical protein [Methylobacterium isbiliense]|jgi:hypothetical protein|uniref:Uncharacterized protein n=1 Tax=Methylobacterium isbiliense TaxID=315478 RepID=A0ABQ4SFZ0_9HYPH|nr:hypothetical protein [Methylobacterium isbiliense]MDN3624516.1 hypothetical protein [Methylobacterium isbiliense]GJE02130.1 hypothetical protein GMJLKIPL_4074 [Methylobacterium isbiliense]
MPPSPHRTILAAVVLAIMGIAAGSAPAAETTPPASEADPAAARTLLDERQANARRQRDGRPSVWMLVPARSKAGPAGPEPSAE